MRICFDIMGNELWTAGHVYLKYLLSALQLTYPELELFLANRSGKPIPRSVLGMFPMAKLIFGDSSEEEAVRAAGARRPGQKVPDPKFSQALRAHAIDVYFGSPYAHDEPSVRTISLLIDFQHRHFPQFFSPEERAERDQYFLDALQRADVALISGESQRADLEALTGPPQPQVKVYHPIAMIPPHVRAAEPSEILERYNLPSDFLYLPNQFWKHKNHEVVIDALGLLKERGEECLVVMTGNPHDYRFPDHFAELEQRIARQGVQHMTRYLGLIPHDDVLLLMRQSKAVLNPSLYEGIGLSVEEAKALGRPVILSDIPAHRERGARGSTYFAASDSRALSYLLALSPALVKAEEVSTSANAKEASTAVRVNAAWFMGHCRH
ncbi:MAG: glycosyltransferase family 4 protein [Bdellovibrionales bacterium]|nr:glycosyltransferase family 4 protein [Bdellovibrionales bacterium]